MLQRDFDMDKNDILIRLGRLKEDEKLGVYRLGLAGSYVKGTNKKSSDIDIVVDTDKMPIDYMERLKDLFKGFDVDVLCLGLLQEEDVELDCFLEKMGLPQNAESVYKNIMKEVVWCE